MRRIDERPDRRPASRGPVRAKRRALALALALTRARDASGAVIARAAEGTELDPARGDDADRLVAFLRAHRA